MKGYKLDQKIPEFRAGQNNIFKVQGVTRSSSGKEFSVLICTQADINQMISDKTDQERIWNLAILEAKNLLKLKHPSLLRVEDKIFEEPSRIVVVIERVYGTLATLFQDVFTSQGGESQIVMDLENEEEEARNNIKNLLNALKFVNKDLKYCHWGVSPESIFLAGNLKSWKLGGFGLMRGFGKVEEESLKPNLYFASYEHFSGANSRSDLFSFGLVALKYFIYIYHLRNSKFPENGGNKRTGQIQALGFGRNSKFVYSSRKISGR